MIRAAQARAARKRYREMAPVLDEQSRHRFVALEAQALGRGGVSLMARVTGLARSTVYHGLSDIRERASAPPARIRKEGGARKNLPSSDRTPPARAPGEPQSNQRRVRWNQVAPGLAVFYRVRGFVPLTPNGH